MKRLFPFLIVFLLLLSACDAQDPSTPSAAEPLAEALPGLAKQGDLESGLLAFGQEMNAALESGGYDVRMESVTYYTESEEAGNTVFFSDVGNKQLGSHFVPGDVRRAWSASGGNAITWASDTAQGDAGPGLGATQAAIASAMATWNAESCSNLSLTDVSPGGDIGFLEFLLTGGASGSPIPAADVVQGGFGTAVDALLPPPIIAAAFTFIFTGGGDINNDGKVDTALREIYYTMNFPWSIGGVGGIDVETVALHETGHGLSQAHFGKLKQTTSNGKFHFAPRAVMNAGYTGAQQTLAGTDNGGHCSIWGSWPNN
ncbi:MAG: hypothetical protein R3247_04190 [Rhodothermales bacterium]|nr:hypothetical protein [Rhodothermales bacterium]